MPPEIESLWLFLPLGYLLTVLIETPVLLVGLSPPHSFARRCFAGLWLTACTYPIVILVLPLLIEPRFGYAAYVAVAEIFAPSAECLLFYVAFGRGLQRRDLFRDLLAITVANLASWLLGVRLLLLVGLS